MKAFNYIDELKLVCTSHEYYLKKLKSFFDIFREFNPKSNSKNSNIREEYYAMLRSTQEFLLDSQYKFWHALNDITNDKKVSQTIIEWKVQIEKISNSIRCVRKKLEAKRVRKDNSHDKNTTKTKIKEQAKEFIKLVSLIKDPKLIKDFIFELKQHINIINELLATYEEINVQHKYIPM